MIILFKPVRKSFSDKVMNYNQSWWNQVTTHIENSFKLHFILMLILLHFERHIANIKMSYIFGRNMPVQQYNTFYPHCSKFCASGYNLFPKHRKFYFNWLVI